MLLGDSNLEHKTAKNNDLYQELDLVSFFFDFFSSKRILTEGEKVSSYWPDLTAQKKAVKKPPATKTLIMIKTIITLMLNLVYRLTNVR